jgi:hypothetical protein
MNDESAKAVQELAKTTGKVVDAVHDAGGFLAPHVDGLLDQVVGMFTDHLKYVRGKRLIRLGHSFQQELLAHGGVEAVRKLPLNFAIDALEQGAMEQDDDLQDIWARLLANAVDATSEVQPRRAYISIIKDLSPLDALILEQIYAVDQERHRKAIVTHELPTRAYPAIDIDLKTLPKPSEDVQVALANLERLGVISYGVSWGGGEVFDLVSQSTAGKAFMMAIRRRHV